MRRVRGVGWCGVLVVVGVVVVGGTARAEEEEEGPPLCDVEGRGGDVASLPAPAAVVLVRGAPFVWPATVTPAYADAEPWRGLVDRARSEEPPGERPALEPATPAALYLAADLAYLRATAGHTDYVEAAGAYERALREAPDFPDAERGWFVLGRARLALGFGPEAGAAFREIVMHFPASVLLPDARLGQAAALRLRGRAREARAVVDGLLADATGALRCRVLAEAARQARATDAAAEAADAWRRVAAECPDVVEVSGALAEYADALLHAGEEDAARALLAGARRPDLPPEEAARLALLAGGLAPDRAAARIEYERVLALPVSPALAVEARMRLALLDAGDRPDVAARALVALAAEPAPRPVRAALLGEAADTAARAGRFDTALALLDRAAALGREGEAQADGRRGEILGRWLAGLAGRGDDAGVAIVYAAHATEAHALASAADRLTIARALGRIGLHGAAVGVLATTAEREGDPETAVTLAEERLASGDVAGAQAILSRLPEPPGPIAQAWHRVAARIALAAGNLDVAAGEAGCIDDAVVRTELAAALLARPGGAAGASAVLAPVVATPDAAPVSALLIAGAAATAERAWGPAADAYRRALLAGATGVDRVAAGVGLARAARARGDEVELALALGVLGGGDAGSRHIGRALAAREVERGR